MSGALLTVAQVAERLAVDERTVRRLVERRELPAVRLGGRAHRPVRVSEADLARQLAAWATTATETAP